MMQYSCFSKNHQLGVFAAAVLSCYAIPGYSGVLCENGGDTTVVGDASLNVQKADAIIEHDEFVTVSEFVQDVSISKIPETITECQAPTGVLTTGGHTIDVRTGSQPVPPSLRSLALEPRPGPPVRHGPHLRRLRHSLLVRRFLRLPRPHPLPLKRESPVRGGPGGRVPGRCVPHPPAAGPRWADRRSRPGGGGRPGLCLLCPGRR